MKILDGWKITKKGGKLLIDMTVPPWSKASQRYHTDEKIVYDDTADILAKGYRPCDGYKTELAYYGMPIYIKFNYWHKCDYINGFTDEYGRPCLEGPGAYP